MLNIAVIGAGHLGEFHIKLLKSSKLFNLIGFFDPNKSRVKEIIDKYNINFIEIDKISSLVDAVIISTPTSFHYETAVKFLNNKKHVFVEKPITSTIEQANKLIEIKKKNKLIGQVGHVERFNSAFLSIKDALNPMFIESHRLSSYPSRGTDVSVVLDLMIHDIDIILSCVNSKIKYISSSGVSIISKSPDIANARIEFENGCVANLTASRVSLKNMRKTRIFQKGKYISIDFLKKESEVVEVENGTDKIPISTLKLNDGQKKDIYYSKPIVKENNAILDELESFANSINKNTKPEVDIVDGHNALKIALKIINEFK